MLESAALLSDATGKVERIHGVLVQEMLVGGLEVLVGVQRDPQFGPVVAFGGVGGVHAELFTDVALRLPPCTREDALAMIAETRAHQLLLGFRGSARRDIDAVVDVLVRVGQLALDFRDVIAEVDVNPLFVFEEGSGAVAADALVALITNSRAEERLNQ